MFDIGGGENRPQPLYTVKLRYAEVRWILRVNSGTEVCMSEQRNQTKRNRANAPSVKPIKAQGKVADPAKLSLARKIIDEDHTILRALSR